VPNFTAQACILFLGALYAMSTAAGWSAFVAITAFGVLVSGFMAVIALWHRHNQRAHPHELDRLLEIARRDDLHG
jgi:hypothetical protein